MFGDKDVQGGKASSSLGTYAHPTTRQAEKRGREPVPLSVGKQDAQFIAESVPREGPAGGRGGDGVNLSGLCGHEVPVYLPGSSVHADSRKDAKENLLEVFLEGKKSSEIRRLLLHEEEKLCLGRGELEQPCRARRALPPGSEKGHAVFLHQH